MTLFRALAYFVREASSNLLRSWRISALAILTISVSLFLTGAFMLLAGNLDRLASRLRAEGKITIYLKAESGDAALARLAELAAEPDWILGVQVISSQTAADRFAATFPSLESLLVGENAAPLPRSLELTPAWRFVRSAPREVADWVGLVSEDEAVDMVDADLDWLAHLEAVVLLIRSAGIIVGVVLLSTAVFTISSVIRLTAYLYREEISVMRLVGATEFFIRGPFYAEGIIQGALGGTLALAGLFCCHFALLERHGELAIVALALPHFLGTFEAAFLPIVGGVAGLVGAIASLHKESLGADEGED